MLLKLVDQRRHPPEDMRILHNLVEIVTDLVDALQEGGIAGAIGLDDKPLPPHAREQPRQVIRRQPGLLPTAKLAHGPFPCFMTRLSEARC